MHVRCLFDLSIFPEAGKGCFSRGRHLDSLVSAILATVLGCHCKRPWSTLADVALKRRRPVVGGKKSVLYSDPQVSQTNSICWEEARRGRSLAAMTKSLFSVWKLGHGVTEHRSRVSSASCTVLT